MGNNIFLVHFKFKFFGNRCLVFTWKTLPTLFSNESLVAHEDYVNFVYYWREKVIQTQIISDFYTIESLLKTIFSRSVLVQTFLNAFILSQYDKVSSGFPSFSLTPNSSVFFI